MQKFYTDKTKLFECQISVVDDTGKSNLQETKARLILEFGNNKNYLFHGKIDEFGKCQFHVPALKETEANEGQVKLEVISESTYDESWSDDFIVTTDKKIQVEVVNNEKEIIKERIKPKVKVITEDAKPKRDILVEDFKEYVDFRNINMNTTLKNKDKFLNVIREYKKERQKSGDDIRILVEKIKKNPKIL